MEPNVLAAVAGSAIVIALGCPTVTAQERAPVKPPATLPDTPAVPACNSDRLANDRQLQPEQRFCIYYHDLTAPTGIAGAVAAAGYAAVSGTEDPAFGTGWKSVTRGVAARYAQSAAKDTGEYLTDWAMHQDPRASRHRGTTAQRIKAAAASLFVTTEQEHMRFKPGPLAGAASGGFVALLWEQRDRQTVDRALEHMGTSLAGSLAGAEFHEFEPQIMRWLSNHFEPRLK